MSSHDSTPTAKRRRVETANATLRKPFRSPLLSRPGAKAGTSAGNPAAGPNFSPEPASRPAAAAWLHKPAQTSPLSGTTTTSLPLKSTTTASYRSAKAQRPRKAVHGSDVVPGDDLSGADDLLTQLHRAQLAVDARLREARAELDLVRQARRLEAEAQAQRPDDDDDAPLVVGPELRALVDRWRDASRMAAEELFGLVRGRVDGMGGPRGLREMRLQARNDDDGSGGGGRVVAEDEDLGSREEEGGEGGKEMDDDETEFTMLMMLKSLNIDPDALGYDPVEDRWRD